MDLSLVNYSLQDVCPMIYDATQAALACNTSAGMHTTLTTYICKISSSKVTWGDTVWSDPKQSAWHQVIGGGLWVEGRVNFFNGKGESDRALLPRLVLYMVCYFFPWNNETEEAYVRVLWPQWVIGASVYRTTVTWQGQGLKTWSDHDILSELWKWD